MIICFACFSLLVHALPPWFILCPVIELLWTSYIITYVPNVLIFEINNTDIWTYRGADNAICKGRCVPEIGEIFKIINCSPRHNPSTGGCLPQGSPEGSGTGPTVPGIVQELSQLSHVWFRNWPTSPMYGSRTGLPIKGRVQELAHHSQICFRNWPIIPRYLWFRNWLTNHRYGSETGPLDWGRVKELTHRSQVWFRNWPTSPR